MLPWYDINLDLEPELRYLQVFFDFKDNIQQYFQKFLESVPESRRKFFGTLAEFIKKFDYDYYMEILSLSQVIEMDIGDCFAVDYVCEATTGCTSILSAMVDEQGNAKMVHGRNLDYPIEVELMKKSSYKGVFTKNGKELCTAIIFAGFQGIYTGIKSNAYSISYNLRNKPEKNGFFKSMSLAFLGYKKWSMIIRDTFINWETFEEAVSYISDTPGINPCYLTVWGIDKGAKLTIDRFKSRINWVYANQIISKSQEYKKIEDINSPCIHYDVQTNFDTFEEAPERDRGRYDQAVEILELISPSKMNEQRMLLSIMNVFPICNEETVYCCFMDPSTYRCTVMFPDPDK